MNNILLIKAREMASDMKKEFPEVDYNEQVKICYKFLKGNGFLVDEAAVEKEENRLPGLEGSNKEIAEAFEIRKHMIEIANIDKEKFDLKSREIKTKFHALNIDRFLKRTLVETDAKWYITNKGLQAMYFSRFVEVK